jgi:hypothetical protein
MASQGPHSGLIIEVPEAEPAVRHHREHLDANAPFGIPAHITVLFPFMPPETIDPPALTRLRQLFAGASRFRFRLDHTDWFGDDVLWLAPQNPRPFRALTQRVFRAYPAFPPFDGQFGEVVPHLTIGHPEPLQIGDILNDPSLLTGLTPEAALIRLGWTGGVPSGWTVTRLGRGGHVGLGFVLRQQFETPRGRIGNTGTMLRWYPGNGRYALPNWKVSLPESGRDIGPDGHGYPTPQSAYWNQPGTPEEIFDLMNGGGGSASNSGEGPTPNSGNDDSGSGTDDTGPCACGGTDPEPFGSDDARSISVCSSSSTIKRQ